MFPKKALLAASFFVAIAANAQEIPPTGPEPEVRRAMVFFAENSSTIPQDQYAAISTACEQINRLHVRRIEITGYCASKESDCASLATRRSLAVKMALVDGGIEAALIEIHASRASTPQGFSKNEDSLPPELRRAAVILLSVSDSNE